MMTGREPGARRASALNLRCSTLIHAKNPAAAPATSAERLQAVLSDLQITLDPPPRPGPDELALAWNALFRCDVEGRASSNPGVVGTEDDVLIDLIVFARPDTILPHASEAGLWLTQSSEPLYPGLRAALVGKKHGDRVSISITFPSEHPIPALRTRSVGCLVDVLDSSPTFAITDRAAWCKTHLGKPMEEVQEYLEDQLLTDWAEDIERMIEVAVLDALCERVPLTPSVEEWMIGAELSTRFEMSEGALLRAKGVPEPMITAHRSAWIQDVERQEVARKAIQRTLALYAVIEAFHLELSPHELGYFIHERADADGISAAELARAIDEAPDEERDGLAQRLLERKAVEMLVGHTRVTMSSTVDLR
ncbi:MAG: hypothetical protein IPK13_14710 [Deltaproteobacteria bacterium]|nr:hypothetical protein [Deltaproteobacteria bacterium]